MSEELKSIPHGVGIVISHPWAAPGIWMSQRSPNANRFPNYWQIPGGKVEEGESAEAAAIREVEEETGLLIKPHMLWEIFSDVFKYPDGTQYRSTNFAYFVVGDTYLPFKHSEPDKQTDHVCVVPVAETQADRLLGIDVMPSTLRAITEGPGINDVHRWLNQAYDNPDRMNVVKELAALAGCHVWSNAAGFAAVRDIILNSDQSGIIAELNTLVKTAWDSCSTIEKAREFLVKRALK